MTTDYIKMWCNKWNISRLDPSYWPNRTAYQKNKFKKDREFKFLLRNRGCNY